jgi:hypothetical protein
MQAVEQNPFLPRVNAVPRSVATAAVARRLQEFYAALLDEPLPDNCKALLERLDERTSASE